MKRVLLTVLLLFLFGIGFLLYPRAVAAEPCRDTCYIGPFCPPGFEKTPGDCGFGNSCCKPAPTPTPGPSPTPTPIPTSIPTPPPICGDGSCNVGEDCSSCPADCGSCPAACPAGYYCEFVSGGPSTCLLNLGIPGACSDLAEPSGNCCLPGVGTYCCEWSGSECVDIISKSGPCPYDCKIANYGPCQQGDLTCTSCKDLTTEAACTDGNMFPNPGNRRLCVEQNPATGYYCAGIFDCQPCFSWSTNPKCNPPQYADPTSCDLACRGIVPIKYRCDAGTCVESGSGQSLSDCLDTCATSPPELCDDAGSIDTAIGCIPVSDTNKFIVFLLRWGIGIGGGIAFILILVAGFQITTSSGDPKRLQAGKELLTSAIAGLLLLIFSAFILRLIGVDILGLPEFGG